MITLPTNNRWTQLNSGEIFGMLFGTKNINFNEEGYAKLALRPSALVYNTSNFTSVNSIDYFSTTNSGYYILTGDNSGRPWRIDLAGTQYDLTADTGGGSIGGSRKYDGVVWQGRWYVTGDTAFAYHNGNATWTTGLGSLTSSYDHIVCVHLGLNSLGISDSDNSVLLYDSTHTLSTTLVIPSIFSITSIKYQDNYFYIGTKHKYGGNAQLFIWNGSGTAAQKSYPIKGEIIFAVENYQNSVVVMTSQGQLLRFNGGGFDVLANLPVFYSEKSWVDSSTTIGRIHRRGMVSEGEILYINIDGTLSDGSMLPNQPSGLWIYDPKVGLSHRAGQSNNKVEIKSISSVDTSTDTFTIPSYTAITGTKVLYVAVSASGGLISGNFYYLIRASSTTFKLATSYANAIAGTAIDITSAGTSGKIYYSDCFDFGSINYQGSSKVGAISLISDLDSNISTYKRMTGSTVLYGVGSLYTYTGTGVNTLQTLTLGLNKGYLISNKIFSSKVKDNWEAISVLFNNLFQSIDSVIIKYRTLNRENLPVCLGNSTVTWTSTTTFTTTSDLTSVAVGDEIEITGGSIAGNMAKVSSLSYSAGTWTVTISSALSNLTVSDTSAVTFDNWSTLTTITGGSLVDQSIVHTIAKSSKWIQFKIELTGVSEVKIEKMIISNNVKQEA